MSLLELNTFAHSVCALATYGLWWHRRADIEDPFVLYTHNSDGLGDLCATQWALGAPGNFTRKNPSTGQISKAPNFKEKGCLRLPTLGHSFLFPYAAVDEALRCYPEAAKPSVSFDKPKSIDGVAYRDTDPKNVVE